ncbi:hypothetical protein TNCV_1999751 [Trichonephila clavipes]|nr:hypothetical protein TNCV_1999751 [Trichonephila clavipes]
MTSHLSFPSTNLTRGLVARLLFRVPPCHKGPIYLQTSMHFSGFEPKSYGTAVSVSNHCTGCATHSRLRQAMLHQVVNDGSSLVVMFTHSWSACHKLQP